MQTLLITAMHITAFSNAHYSAHLAADSTTQNTAHSTAKPTYDSTVKYTAYNTAQCTLPLYSTPRDVQQSCTNVKS